MADILSIILYFLVSWQALRMYAFRWRGFVFVGRFESRIKTLERAQAARALAFPFGRKRKQKGPFSHGTAAAAS